jgi:putative iron-dependent peroxidase
MTAEESLQAGAATAPVTVPQPVAAPLTSAAIFCILEVRSGEENLAPVRALCGDLAALLRAVGFRATEAGLSCVMGLSSGLWDRLAARGPRPAGLHPFRELLSDGRHAPATAGDLLFHIRSSRMDLCFELATQILTQLGGAVAPVDEVHGFRYFDERDLIGFVDGTENPTGQDAIDATVIGPEDAAFAGGSYVIVQKYLHDLGRWNALPVEEQERIVGRTKLTNIELDDDVKPSYAHNALTSLTDEAGNDIDIVRDNMPFGRPSDGEFGTYFIGYARSPEPVEQMLENMFVGLPPGNYDRLLDVSRAVTGVLFFVPSAGVLASLAVPPAEGAGQAAAGDGALPPAAPGQSGGSLGIGSLRGESEHE